MGSNVTLTHVANETIKSEATSAGYSITTSSDLGTYCFRAVYNSTSPQYDGVDDANTTTECFTVQTAASATSTQDWLPNDHITVTSDAGSIAGKITVQLFQGSCDPAVGTLKYTDTPVGGATFTATSSGTTYDTDNSTSNATSFLVTSANATDYFWRAVFTPDSSNAGGAVIRCEKSTLTINNSP